MLGVSTVGGPGNADPLGLVGLTPLIGLSEGDPGFCIGLVDGRVDVSHPELADASIHHVGDEGSNPPAPAAITHATFAAGVLVGGRGGVVPALVPRCTLLVCPIFGAAAQASMPSTSPADLAYALAMLVTAGAKVINVSAELLWPAPSSEQCVSAALDHAAGRGVLVVGAMGNRGRLGGSVLTRHPWAIPVVACDLSGNPTPYSNLSRSSARHGLRAPGEGVTGPAAHSGFVALTGSSVAALLVTGAIALVWSVHRRATPHVIRTAVLGSSRRSGIVPPLLDAWRAHLILRKQGGSR
jgi:subtilisin family serine protease